MGKHEGLTDVEKAMLALEQQRWNYSGAKEQTIRDLFNVSATRYYSKLNDLIDTEAAMAHDPLTVKRLRRLREARQRQRRMRRRGFEI